MKKLKVKKTSIGIRSLQDCKHTLIFCPWQSKSAKEGTAIDIAADREEGVRVEALCWVDNRLLVVFSLYVRRLKRDGEEKAVGGLL